MFAFFHIYIDKINLQAHHMYRFYCPVKLRALPWTQGLIGQKQPPQGGCFYFGLTYSGLPSIILRAVWGSVRYEVTISTRCTGFFPNLAVKANFTLEPSLS